MAIQTTTWEEVTAFLRALILCCCRSKEGWILPSSEGWTLEREQQVDLWIQKQLRPTLDREIPSEVRWGLFQRARAAGTVAANAVHHHEPQPTVSLPQLLDILLLKMAGKLPQADNPPVVPPWLE